MIEKTDGFEADYEVLIRTSSILSLKLSGDKKLNKGVYNFIKNVQLQIDLLYVVIPTAVNFLRVSLSESYTELI